MASSLIGSLRVALSLGTADFEAGATKAAAIARGKSKEIEGAFATAKTAVAGFFAAFTVGLLAEQVKKSLEYAGSLAEVSRTLGVTTTDLQTFRFAATQTGVAQDQLEVGLRRLTVSMGKAELGSKEQAKAFGAIGISLDQLKGKSTGEVFRLMADGLSKVTDHSQRAAIEMTLMGRSGSTLDNLLAPGSKRLNELSEAAKQLGIVLSDSQIQGAEETAHKLAAVKEVLSAQIAGVVANNANAILGLSSALATLTASIVRFLGSNPQLALGIVGALLGANIGKVAGTYGALAGALAGGVGGALLGGKMSRAAADSNLDIAFRRQQVINAKNALLAARSAPDAGGRVLPGIGIPASSGGQANVLAAIKELNRQTDLLKAAAAAAKAQPFSPDGVDVPKIFAPGGGKPKKVRTPTDRSDEVLFQLTQEEIRAQQDILAAKLSLSHDIGERAQISLQILQLDAQSRDAELDHRVQQAAQDLAEKHITKATYDQVVHETAILKAKGAEADALNAKAIIEQRDLDLSNQQFDIDQHRLQVREGILQKEGDLAETAAERRKIELELLDLAYQEKRQAIQHILETSKDAAELAKARTDLASLNTNYALDKQGVNQQTRGPLEQFGASLPLTADKWKESLQQVAVDGFGSLEQAILDTVSGTKKLSEAFHEMAATILQDLLKLAIEKYIIGSIMSAFGAAGGASTSTETLSASGGYTGVGGSLPGFASGGSIMVGGNRGTDSNMLALNGMPIARVSYGERINVANDRGSPTGLTMYNDFSGVDPASVARVEAKLDSLRDAIPGMVVTNYSNARDRFIIRK